MKGGVDGLMPDSAPPTAGNRRRIIRIIKIKCALHHQYVCLGTVNMSFPRRRESRFPSGHYADGKLCRAQKLIMIGINPPKELADKPRYLTGVAKINGFWGFLFFRF